MRGPVWVALLAEVCVGAVAVAPKGDRRYVRSMAVAPTARGHGVGWKLIEEVERFARAHNVRSMHLSTTTFLHDAIRLYERFGFLRTDNAPHALAGTPLFAMGKLLM